jgi:hypothetical protein
MHAQIFRRLHIRNAALLDQAHSLKLVLACKLPSLHDPHPVPSKHLTRCLRNRQQLKYLPMMIRLSIVKPKEDIFADKPSAK